MKWLLLVKQEAVKVEVTLMALEMVRIRDGDAHLLKISDFGGGRRSNREYTTVVLDEVILDPSFKNNDCLMDIYNKMGGSATFDMYLKKFDKEMSIADLRFLADKKFAENHDDALDAAAITIGPEENKEITIVFNTDENLPKSNINKFSQLIMAQTLFHEVIHAEIYRQLLEASKEGYITWDLPMMENLEKSHRDTWDYYLKYWWNGDISKDVTTVQHQLMADKYIDIMSQAISEFDDNKRSQEFYESLAWLGLKDQDIVS